MKYLIPSRKDLSFELNEIAIRRANNVNLLEISKELGLALNLEEMKSIKSYFLSKCRDPTDVELQTLSQTWSEHCFHKTFKRPILTDKGKEINSLFRTYIYKSTKELNKSWCISVFEDNAGIIEFEGEIAVAIKIETHNHPSAIEPFGGAATGTGGVIRDILGVWAEPIACTDVLGFGPLDFDFNKLPTGVKHPRYVYRGVVAGIGHYGNDMGIPTVNGAIYFDESYTGNVVVYCGCIGTLPLKKYIMNAKPGHNIVLAGGRTGRDGIHGVTFASLELTEKSEEISRPAVQIANPIEEEKLKRAIITIRDKELASSITDLGGGGLSSAVGETASRFGCGAVIELEKVPLKYSNIPPWEIYISESQERMLLTVPDENLAKVLEIFGSEYVEASCIGRLIEEKILRLFYKQFTVAELDMLFLFNPPLVRRFAEWKKQKLSVSPITESEDLNEDLKKIISSPNVSSKESAIRSYDHEVKGNTVLKPLCGKFGGPSDAAVIKPLNSSWKGLAISCGMNPRYGKIDPYWMAASVIDEAIRNNVAVGGRRIALLDNFVWGSPDKPDRLGSLVRACEACYFFSKGFETPFISGKDSLYNESPLGSVSPTLLITAIGIVPDIKRIVTMDLKNEGDLVYLVGNTYSELGGSEYFKIRGYPGGSVPKVRLNQAKRTIDSIIKAIELRYIKSCHDLSEGGLGVAASEMAFSSGYGLDIQLDKVPRVENIRRNDYIMFSESNSRFLVEVPKKLQDRFEYIMKGTSSSLIGRVKKEKTFSVYGLDRVKVVDINLEKLMNAWKSPLEI
jgi:phosphoribosylformylglycinamidine synthase